MIYKTYLHNISVELLAYFLNGHLMLRLTYRKQHESEKYYRQSEWEKEREDIQEGINHTEDITLYQTVTEGLQYTC